MGKVKAVAFIIVAVLFACCLGLAACGEQSRSEPGDVIVDDGPDLLVTPSYYVFDSFTTDGDTITDPSELFLDRQGETENWYFLTIAIHTGTKGRLCSDGRIADFTYERVDDTIILDVPLDFGFDGAKLELGEGTLTMIDATGTTVLRLVDEAPTAALAE